MPRERVMGVLWGLGRDFLYISILSQKYVNTHIFCLSNANDFILGHKQDIQEGNTFWEIGENPTK